MIRGTVRGHAVVYTDEWRWEDTGEPVGEGVRACTQCGVTPDRCEEDGGYHDPCLGHIEGIASACCGHGIFTGYVKWPHSENVREGWHKSVRVC